MTEPFGSLFVSVVPDVAAARCLNSRHHDAGCVRCVTLCPVMAIGLPGLTPEIDSSVCVMCGMCVAVCPTSAITVPRPFEVALGRAVESCPDADIGLVCAYYSNPSRSSAPVQTIVRHGMCLGSLDAADLLGLAGPGGRRVWLDTSECSSCPIAPTLAVIKYAAMLANRLVAEDTRPDPVGVVWGAGSSSRGRVVVEGAHPGLTRRGLFTLAKPDPVAADEPMVRAGGAVKDRLPVALPRSRRRLLEQLERWDGGGQSFSTGESPFAAVQVDPDKCSGCGLCGLFCPTGSLAFHFAPGEFALGFKVSLCIDCGICAIACPEDAISFGSEIDSILVSDWSVLLSGHQTSCSVCHQPTRGEPGGTVRCYACRNAGT